MVDWEMVMKMGTLPKKNGRSLISGNGITQNLLDHLWGKGEVSKENENIKQNPPGGKPGGIIVSTIDKDVEQSLGVHMRFILEMRGVSVGITRMEEFGDFLRAFILPFGDN